MAATKAITGQYTANMLKWEFFVILDLQWFLILWRQNVNWQHKSIARMSGHPILSPRRTATTENVENNHQNGQRCTNSNSHVKVGIVGKKSGLVIIGMVIVFVS